MQKQIKTHTNIQKKYMNTCSVNVCVNNPKRFSLT